MIADFRLPAAEIEGASVNFAGYNLIERQVSATSADVDDFPGPHGRYGLGDLLADRLEVGEAVLENVYNDDSNGAS